MDQSSEDAFNRADGKGRLERQIAFLMEADKIKTVLRRNRVVSDPSRRENDAEHMYHLALMAVILAEHANTGIDLLKVLKMVLAHDLVEIDAGDTFMYDMAAQAGKREREELAAERIFGLLPPDQATEMRAVWEEFEAEETAEARFAASLDRLQPLLGNCRTGGGVWTEYQITTPQVYAQNTKIERGSTGLWTFAQELLEEAQTNGYLSPE